MFLYGRNTMPPRCIECRRREESWADVIAAWNADPEAYRWSCPACGHQARPFDLDWRQSAGFGRFFVEVWGIHPAEAIPSDALLDALTRSTRKPWSFFYWQGD